MELEASLPHSHVPATFQTLPIPFFILGISQLGHKTRPGHCNMQHWRFSSDWSCMCVFEVSLTALYFRVTYCPPASTACAPFMQVPCVPEWSWEHKALVCMGNKLWRQGNNLPCGEYYSEFLDFFPVWGEHSVNHGWLCSGECVCVCVCVCVPGVWT